MKIRKDSNGRKRGYGAARPRPDETGRIALEPTQSGQVGQWFTDPDKNEVYVTDSLVETEDQILAEVHLEDPQTWLAETQFNLSFDADWSQAEILPYAQDSTGLLPVAMNLSEAAQPRFALMKQQFEVGGTQVSWSVAASGIHVHAAKKMTNGATLQMDYDLTGVHPVIAWNGLGKEGRLQLDFTMSESAGLTRGVSNTLTSDFSGLDPHDLLSSLTASFTNARKEADTVIPHREDQAAGAAVSDCRSAFNSAAALLRRRQDRAAFKSGRKHRHGNKKRRSAADSSA